MKFSVIVPIYNSADYLRACVDSILAGLPEDAELILIDDGSSDASPELCREYAARDRRVVFFRQPNGGPAAARNRGISLARGDYLTFVDSDDTISPDTFAILSKAAEGTPDLIFFGIEHIRGEERVNHFFSPGSWGNKSDLLPVLCAEIHAGDLNSSVNKAFSRRLFSDGLRYPEGTVVEEDLIFVLRAIEKAASFVSIQDGLYFYNCRAAGSVTTKYNPDKFDCKCAATREQLAWAERNDSQAFADVFRDSHLSYVSSSVNNLMYAACPLTKKEKLAEIRRFFAAEETRDSLANAGTLSARSRMMKALIRGRLVRTTYFIHHTVFRLRHRGGGQGE